MTRQSVRIGKISPSDVLKKPEAKTVTGEQLLIERFGAEKVKEWQKEYAPRKLSVINVEGKFAILKPIGANEVANFSMMVANVDMGIDKASEYLMNELWIDGDNELLSDEEYFISAMMQLQRVIEVKKSSFFQL